MCASTKLHGNIRNVNHSHNITILLTKHCHRTCNENWLRLLDSLNWFLSYPLLFFRNVLPDSIYTNWQVQSITNVQYKICSFRTDTSTSEGLCCLACKQTQFSNSTYVVFNDVLLICPRIPDARPITISYTCAIIDCYLNAVACFECALQKKIAQEIPAALASAIGTSFVCSTWPSWIHWLTRLSTFLISSSCGLFIIWKHELL